MLRKNFTFSEVIAPALEQSPVGDMTISALGTTTEIEKSGSFHRYVARSCIGLAMELMRDRSTSYFRAKHGILPLIKRSSQ